MGLLSSAIHPMDLEYVSECTTVLEALEALRVSRHGRSDSHVADLLFQAYNVRMQPGESVRSLVSRVKLLHTQLQQFDIKIPEEAQAVCVLTAADSDSRFHHQVQHMLGVGLQLTLNNVQSALTVCETPGSGSAPPNPTALTTQGEPVADHALALLSTKLDGLLNRINKGGISKKDKDRQQSNSKGGGAAFPAPAGHA